MTFKVEVQGIEDSITVFDNVGEATAFIDAIIDRAVEGHEFAQIDVYKSNGAHECGWTVHEDGTIEN